MSMNVLYSIREGVLGLRRARTATTITISIIAVTLTLFGIFVIFTANVQRIVNTFRTKMTLEVFIENTIRIEELSRLEGEIKKVQGVEFVEYFSKEQAMERFKRDFGEEMVKILGEYALPASFLVRMHPQYRSYEKSKNVALVIEGLAGVDEVIHHGRLFQFVDRYSRIILIVDVIIFILVLFCTIVLVSNTLRLTIMAQFSIIQIMELVGATRGFIRRPYLVQGILQSGIGGCIATMIIWIIMQLVKLRFPYLLAVSTLQQFIPFFLSVFLGFLGSEIGLRRFFKA